MSSVVKGAHLPTSSGSDNWVAVPGRSAGPATFKERLADAIRRTPSERRSADYDPAEIGEPDRQARDIARSVAEFWAD